MAATTPLREALNQGISSGKFVDTKIILYSRRDSSRRVYQPKALYANSHVLRTVPYFEDLLFKDFKEAQAKDFKEAIDEDESGEDYGYSSDSDLEDDEIDEVLSVKDTVNSRAHPATPEEEKIACEVHDESIEKGKVVKIPDVAFVTFQAFLMYLYTGEIEFAPFGSEENRRSRSTETVTSPDDIYKFPRPSPKPIYRLADKYDVPGLKYPALGHIRCRLISYDIVEESFSKFASRYDEIRDLCAERLASIWMEDSTAESARTNIKNKIKSFVEGDLDHAAEIVAALWKIASGDGSATGLATYLGEVRLSPDHWGSVKAALIKSIRKGVFFDRKYWVRYSTAGDVLKPVYFSSVIMDDKSPQLRKLVKRHKGRNPFASDPEGDINIESDCEEAEDELPDAKEEEEEPARAVFLTGSFSAWKSLFFYRCTDVVSFAPLRSQGVDVRRNHILEKSVAVKPPPCSPKSVYVLANLLELPFLCEEALADIKRKLTLDNIVDEIFSRVTGSQKEIMEMQCDLLIENFKEPSTIRLVTENIKRIPDRSSSQCADTLNLMLEKAFEAKKQRECVKLRCTHYNCPSRGEPIPYSFAESDTYHCRRGYYMECVGCGHSRTDNYSSCQGCGKRFI